jgi:hypothetical protein
MRIHAKRVIARAFRLTILLFGVVLLFGSLSPVSSATIGIALGSPLAVETTATNGLRLSGKRREDITSNLISPHSGIGGCNDVLASLFYLTILSSQTFACRR